MQHAPCNQSISLGSILSWSKESLKHRQSPKQWHCEKQGAKTFWLKYKSVFFKETDKALKNKGSWLRQGKSGTCMWPQGHCASRLLQQPGSKGARAPSPYHPGQPEPELTVTKYSVTPSACCPWHYDFHMMHLTDKCLGLPGLPGRPKCQDQGTNTIQQGKFTHPAICYQGEGIWSHQLGANTKINTTDRKESIGSNKQTRKTETTQTAFMTHD